MEITHTGAITSNLFLPENSVEYFHEETAKTSRPNSVLSVRARENSFNHVNKNYWIISKKKQIKLRESHESSDSYKFNPYSIKRFTPTPRGSPKFTIQIPHSESERHLQDSNSYLEAPLAIRRNRTISNQLSFEPVLQVPTIYAQKRGVSFRISNSEDNLSINESISLRESHSFEKISKPTLTESTLNSSFSIGLCISCSSLQDD